MAAWAMEDDICTFFALAVLEELHSLKGGTATDELVGKLGLMGLAVVDLVTLALGVVWDILVSMLHESGQVIAFAVGLRHTESEHVC